MLGAHLLYDLTKAGTKVRALKRKNSDPEAVRKIFSWYSDEADRLFRQIEWLEGDLLDVDSLRAGLEGIDTVIHAAAKVSFDPADRVNLLHENIQGTIHLVELAKEFGIKRFCHVSSIASLGEQTPGIPMDEDFAWRNDGKRSAYAESKFQSEMEVWRGIHEGLNCVIVNPSVIFGPGNWHNGSPRFFTTVRNGMKFYPSGGTGFVDVRDVSRAIIGLLSEDTWESVRNQRYLLSAENLSYREVFSRIADSLNRPRPRIEAGRFLLQTGWRIAALAAFLTGKSPALTRDTARSSIRTSLYDGSKITRTIDFNYTPVAKTIEDIGRIFLADQTPVLKF